MSDVELKLKDGDYVMTGGGTLCSVRDSDALVQRALMRLTARRGAFLPLPDYGSRLFALGRVKSGERAAAARQYVTEALAEEPEIIVESVEYLPDTEDSATVCVTLRCGEQNAELTLAV